MVEMGRVPVVDVGTVNMVDVGIVPMGRVTMVDVGIVPMGRVTMVDVGIVPMGTVTMVAVPQAPPFLRLVSRIRTVDKLWCVRCRLRRGLLLCIVTWLLAGSRLRAIFKL